MAQENKGRSCNQDDRY